MKKIYLLILLPLLLMSCVSKTKYDDALFELNDLKQKYDKLFVELNSYKTAPSFLLNKAKISFENQSLDSLTYYKNLLSQYHPGSKEEIQINKMIEDVNKQINDNKVAEENKRLSSVKKLKKKYDDIKGITWYKNPYFTHFNNSNLTSIYIGQTKSEVWLRLEMSYEGDDWIFFDKAYLSHDGITEDIYFDKYDNKKSDNSGSGVWEWIDVPVDNSLISFLKDLSQSKNAKMRLSGKYTKTRNLSNNEKKGILDVINAYEVLSNEIANKNDENKFVY